MCPTSSTRDRVDEGAHDGGDCHMMRRTPGTGSTHSHHPQVAKSSSKAARCRATLTRTPDVTGKPSSGIFPKFIKRAKQHNAKSTQTTNNKKHRQQQQTQPTSSTRQTTKQPNNQTTKQQNTQTANTQHATRNTQHATHNTQHATHNTQHTTHNKIT